MGKKNQSSESLRESIVLCLCTGLLIELSCFFLLIQIVELLLDIFHCNFSGKQGRS